MKSQLLTLILVLIFNAITAQIVPCNTTVLDEPFNSSNIPGANSAVLLNNGMAGSNHENVLYTEWKLLWMVQSNERIIKKIFRQSFSTTLNFLGASMWVQESFGGTSITLSLKDIFLTSGDSENTTFCYKRRYQLRDII